VGVIIQSLNHEGHDPENPRYKKDLEGNWMVRENGEYPPLAQVSTCAFSY
jgi:hypothetical protein